MGPVNQLICLCMCSDTPPSLAFPEGELMFPTSRSALLGPESNPSQSFSILNVCTCEAASPAFLVHASLNKRGT